MTQYVDNDGDTWTRSEIDGLFYCPGMLNPRSFEYIQTNFGPLTVKDDDDVTQPTQPAPTMTREEALNKATEYVGKLATNARGYQGRDADEQGRCRRALRPVPTG
ncbi:gp1.3 [Streptomyces phage phiBT1]|uniref:Gp1.3 n=1 Tax=Lomovskayavirus BT1 TaxID=225588 RepID=Q859A0_9CAUD|nr:gp1.3 [Streptomyces phage phiBT1]CAD80125.1 gp1.3 [Lomovskayavirus BT1]